MMKQRPPVRPTPPCPRSPTSTQDSPAHDEPAGQPWLGWLDPVPQNHGAHMFPRQREASCPVEQPPSLAHAARHTPPPVSELMHTPSAQPPSQTRLHTETPVSPGKGRQSSPAAQSAGWRHGPPSGCAETAGGAGTSGHRGAHARRNIATTPTTSSLVMTGRWSTSRASHLRSVKPARGAARAARRYLAP